MRFEFWVCTQNSKRINSKFKTTQQVMTETIFTHTLEVCLWLLVAFLLGLLAGYIIWYKWRRMYLELHREHERLSQQHRDLEKEHSNLRYKYEELEKNYNKCRTRVGSLEGDVTVLKNKLKACREENEGKGGGGKKMKKEAGIAVGSGTTRSTQRDDLKKIEGIGPKIEKLCNGIGVYTWRQLAETPVETLQKNAR